eukprot:s189_g3.t1
MRLSDGKNKSTLTLLMDICVMLAAWHERRPDQTHQGLQFAVPLLSTKALGRELSADFHLLGRGCMRHFLTPESTVFQMKLLQGSLFKNEGCTTSEYDL